MAPSNVEAIWRNGSFHARIGHMERALALFGKALERAPESARHAIRLEVLDCPLSLGRIDEARDVGGDARDGADIVAALALQITAFGAKIILHVHNEQRGMPRMQLPVQGAYNGRHFFFCLNSSGAGITVPQCLQVRKSSEVKKFS